MKTANQYFEVGAIFLDNEINSKVECVEMAFDTCENCVYDAIRHCNETNTPKCIPDERPDKKDVIFIRFEDNDILRIKEVESL